MARDGLNRPPNRRLRRQRQLRGWSLDDLAAELCKLAASLGEPMPGVNSNMVSRWERGVRSPRPYYVRLLCTLFEQSAEQLGLVEAGDQSATSDERGGDDRHRESLVVGELLGVPRDAVARLQGETRDDMKRRAFLMYGIQ